MKTAPSGQREQPQRVHVQTRGAACCSSSPLQRAAAAAGCTWEMRCVLPRGAREPPARCCRRVSGQSALPGTDHPLRAAGPLRARPYIYWVLGPGTSLAGLALGQLLPLAHLLDPDLRAPPECSPPPRFCLPRASHPAHQIAVLLPRASPPAHQYVES